MKYYAAFKNARVRKKEIKIVKILELNGYRGKVRIGKKVIEV